MNKTLISFELISKLPLDILNELPNNIDEIIKKITILDSNVATGIVFKINIEGNLEQDNYELGYLYLLPGSSIKNHMHINQIETYTLIQGDLSINDIKYIKDYCHIGESHSIDQVKDNTIIKTYKVKSKLFKK